MPAMVKNRSKRWRGRSCFRWLPVLVICAWMTQSVDSITGSHVCMEKQKYNVTKRIKYRAPMAVRTYEWCLAVPPRCSRWSTEMRDLTRLETEERTAEIAVCCPGFVMRSATCQPKCPSGKTGHNCTEQCRKKLWGPSCSKECADCPPYSSCSPVTGNCVCDDERKGERCEQVITDTTVAPTNTTVPLSSGIRTSERVIPTNRDYSSSTVNTVVTKNTPATTLIPQTKKFTTAKAQGSQQLFSVAQDLDFSTENSIPTFNNTSRSFDDQMETTEMATTQWIVTKSPFLTTTNHKTSSENLSTFKTPQADNLNLTIQPQLEVSSIMPSTKIEITTKSAKFMTTQPNNKPKEIWIKPTQKGDSILMESKRIYASATVPPKLYETKKDPIPFMTTPRTIIVNIIPTSVAHTTAFKKITFSASDIKPSMQKVKIYTKNQTHSSFLWKIVTVANKFHTSTIPAINRNSHTETPSSVPKKVPDYTVSLSTFPNMTKLSSNTHFHTKQHIIYKQQNISTTRSTNKIFNPTPSTLNSWIDIMPTDITTLSKNKSSFYITPSKSNSSISLFKAILLPTFPTTRRPLTSTIFMTTIKKISTSDPSVAKKVITIQRNESTVPKFMIMDDIVTSESIKSLQLIMGTNASSKTDSIGKVATKFQNELKKEPLTKLTTTNPYDSATNNKETTNKVTPIEKQLDQDEVFDILTEPEHITAVVGDAGSERNTDNLLTVLSLAGGVMFAVITVAIVIVMIERCRRSKYEELMKLHNMRRKALEGEEDPPPYVRSIFHTPLPDPPITEKSHYQPISTLDRNVKQFMRPVAVHSISPIMLENFRGILECHYDHLPPRRSHISFKSDTLSCQYRCSTTPSMECASELCPQHSPLSEKTLPVTDLSVETLKHEGTVEMIDLSTAEPLYAEIPCWRPASQHAIEVVNLNGEAVTEL